MSICMVRISSPTIYKNPKKQILAHVLAHLPRTASIAISLAGVCPTWRAAILAEENYLRDVNFKLDCNQPFRGLAPIRGTEV